MVHNLEAERTLDASKRIAIAMFAAALSRFRIDPYFFGLIGVFLHRWLGCSTEDAIAIVFSGSKKSMAGGIPTANILFPGGAGHRNPPGGRRTFRGGAKHKLALLNVTSAALARKSLGLCPDDSNFGQSYR
jgi:hypothetical protein